MDPFSALGAAAAVVQFVDFSSRILSEGGEFYRNDTLIEHKDIVQAAASVTQLSNRLNDSLDELEGSDSYTFEESALKTIVEECRTNGHELVATLRQLEVHGKNKEWKSLRLALKSHWKKGSIQQTHQHLNSLRESMAIHLLVILKILEAINHSTGQLSSAITEISNSMALQGFHERLPKAQIWQALKQSSVPEIIGCVKCQRRSKQATDFVLSTLYFNELHDRYHKIPAAHLRTYKWIFGDASAESGNASFKEWLETPTESTSIYWIAGKAGSGKSTLMRYLYDAPETARCLKSWQRHDTLVFVRVFFWSCGAAVQNSLTGLLRSLLYQLLSTARETIQQVLPDRWRSAVVATEFGFEKRVGIEAWSAAEMIAAIRDVVRLSRGVFKIFLLIDGLDEFQGTNAELLLIVNLLKDISNSGTAKVCASSRPWMVYQDEFENCPRLRLEYLTEHDIELYATDMLGSSKAVQDRSQGEFNELAVEITEKSEGVFLWAGLVVRKMLNDVRNGSDLTDLRRKLRRLPSNLEDLFKYMLSTIEPVYSQNKKTGRQKRICRKAVRTKLPDEESLYSMMEPLD